MNSKLIAPSLLASDFANLQRDIEMVNNSDADWFHIDRDFLLLLFYIILSFVILFLFIYLTKIKLK